MQYFSKTTIILECYQFFHLLGRFPLGNLVKADCLLFVLLVSQRFLLDVKALIDAPFSVGILFNRTRDHQVLDA
jgi:hypothetical protein